MFCPNCAQERTSPETKFCSACGYLLTGTAQLMAVGGEWSSRPGGAASPRSRGVKQGVFTLLLGFLIVPLVVVLSVFLHVGPFFAIVSALSLFVGGLLRMAYAALFESSIAGMPTLEEEMMATAGGYLRGRQQRVLPPQTTIPASDFSKVGAGNWRDTNELQPTQIAESATTQLTSGDLH